MCRKRIHDNKATRVYGKQHGLLENMLKVSVAEFKEGKIVSMPKAAKQQ